MSPLPPPPRALSSLTNAAASAAVSSPSFRTPTGRVLDIHSLSEDLPTGVTDPPSLARQQSDMFKVTLAGSPHSSGGTRMELVESPQHSTISGGSANEKPGMSPLLNGGGRVRSSSTIQASPRLHSLPDNSLNPLGLLAEASLQNSHRKRSMNNANNGGGDGNGGDLNRQELHRIRDGILARGKKGKGKKQQQQQNELGLEGAASGGRGGRGTGEMLDNAAPQPPRLGVGDEHYFKPGPMAILPLRRVFIEREVSDST